MFVILKRIINSKCPSVSGLHLGGTGLSGQAELALEALLVLVGDPALGDGDVQPLPDHGDRHAVSVLHLLTRHPGQQHRGVDTLLIGVWEQNLNLAHMSMSIKDNQFLCTSATFFTTGMREGIL